MLYRIFTEDKNQEGIEKIVNKYYPGFTLIKSEGYWRLQKENSLVIEIVTEDKEVLIKKDEEIIKKIAGEIRIENNQEAVLVQKIENQQWLITE